MGELPSGRDTKTLATFVISIVVAGIIVIFISGLAVYLPQPQQPQQPDQGGGQPPYFGTTTTPGDRTTTTTTTGTGNTVGNFTITGSTAPPASILVNILQPEPRNLGLLLAVVGTAGIILLVRRQR